MNYGYGYLQSWVPVNTSVTFLETTSIGVRLDAYARGTGSIMVFTVSSREARVKFSTSVTLASTTSGVLFKTHGDPFVYSGEIEKVSFASNSNTTATHIDFAVFKRLGEDK